MGLAALSCRAPIPPSDEPWAGGPAGITTGFGLFSSDARQRGRTDARYGRAAIQRRAVRPGLWGWTNRRDGRTALRDPRGRDRHRCETDRPSASECTAEWGNASGRILEEGRLHNVHISGDSGDAVLKGFRNFRGL